MDISSNVNWIEMGVGVDTASFETGGATNYPYIRWASGNKNEI